MPYYIPPEWPRNSIPRRVKKLSWEDEYDLGGSPVFDVGFPNSGASIPGSEISGSILNNGTAAGVPSIASGTMTSSIVAQHQHDRDISTLTDTEGATAVTSVPRSSSGPPPYTFQNDPYNNLNGASPSEIQIGKSIYF